MRIRRRFPRALPRDLVPLVPRNFSQVAEIFLEFRVPPDRTLESRWVPNGLVCCQVVGNVKPRAQVRISSTAHTMFGLWLLKLTSSKVVKDIPVTVAWE